MTSIVDSRIGGPAVREDPVVSLQMLREVAKILEVEQGLNLTKVSIPDLNRKILSLWNCLRKNSKRSWNNSLNKNFELAMKLKKHTKDRLKKLKTSMMKL